MNPAMRAIALAFILASAAGCSAQCLDNFEDVMESSSVTATAPIMAAPKPQTAKKSWMARLSNSRHIDRLADLMQLGPNAYQRIDTIENWKRRSPNKGMYEFGAGGMLAGGVSLAVTEALSIIPRHRHKKAKR